MLLDRKVLAKIIVSNEKIAALLGNLGSCGEDFIHFISRDGWIVVYEPELPDFINLALNVVIKYTTFDNNTHTALQQLQTFKGFYNVNIHHESKKYRIGESLLLRSIDELNGSRAINFATEHEGSKILIIRKIYWVGNNYIFASIIEVVAEPGYIKIK